MDHVTVTNNTSDIDNNGTGIGGGICSNVINNGVSLCGTTDDHSGANAQTTISNSIIAGNTTGNGMASDCFGLVTSSGFNVF